MSFDARKAPGVLSIMALAAMASASVTGCGGKPAPPATSPPALATQAGDDSQRPECPADTLFVRDSSHHLVRKPYLAISAANTLIPEYNDCQRFPLGAGQEYGPLVGIFARDSLDTYVAAALALAQKRATRRALAMATIYDWDAPYPTLHIPAGYSCLYMWFVTGPGGPARQAAVVMVASDTDCAAARDPATISKADYLVVTPHNYGTAYVNADYPPVARWDWDRKASQEFISIGCLARWCDIGPAGLTSDVPLPYPSPNPHIRRLMQIKGWHDQQRLAESDPQNSAKLIASKVVGTILPTANLESDKDLVANFAKWDTVAKTYLSQPSAFYKHKLNFDAGSLSGNSFNVIALCRGTMLACHVPASSITQPNCAVTPGDLWWGMIISAKGDTAYRCVIRRTHMMTNGKPVAIPAIVRWRWSVKDEKGWIACPAGCCELTGDP